MTIHYSPNPAKSSWIILISSALLIKIFSFFPALVEKYYTNIAYRYISGTQRVLFGWIPFSLGDVFYFACLIYLLWQLFYFIKAIFKGRLLKRSWINAIQRLCYLCLVIYVSFNLLWGLNYNRPPMARKMGFPLERYSTESLKAVLENLVLKLNTFDSTARIYRTELKVKKSLFGEAIESYARVKNQYPALNYKFSSVKPSVFSYVGNYLGFTGYYNPFSGEAQANTTVPSFIQPFTTCHEIGHQLGYAKENEANFAGFLAARSSLNAAFRYSVYLDMYSYSIRELYLRDSAQVKVFTGKLNSHVTDDFQTIRQFYKKYENPIEPLIRALYANYLKANQQPSGMHSYNEVVAMLVAYYKRYGDL